MAVDLEALVRNRFVYPSLSDGGSPEATVEGAGQISNLAVSDVAWTYASLYALSYQGDPDQADACAAVPAQAPNLVPKLLVQVRQQHDALRAQGASAPRIPSFVGLEGTGF